MTKLNMASETTKPQTAQTPADTAKHDQVKPHAEPSTTPAAAPVEKK